MATGLDSAAALLALELEMAFLREGTLHLDEFHQDLTKLPVADVAPADEARALARTKAMDDRAER
jgi:hypothetical protein